MCMELYRRGAFMFKWEAETYRKTSNTQAHAHTQLQSVCTSKRALMRPSCVDFIAAGTASPSMLPVNKLKKASSLWPLWRHLYSASASIGLGVSRPGVQRRCSVCIMPDCTDLSRNAAEEQMYPTTHRITGTVNTETMHAEGAEGFPLAKLNLCVSYLLCLDFWYLSLQSVPFSWQTTL